MLTKRFCGAFEIIQLLELNKNNQKLCWKTHRKRELVELCIVWVLVVILDRVSWQLRGCRPTFGICAFLNYVKKYKHTNKTWNSEIDFKEEWSALPPPDLTINFLLIIPYHPQLSLIMFLSGGEAPSRALHRGGLIHLCSERPLEPAEVTAPLRWFLRKWNIQTSKWVCLYPWLICIFRQNIGNHVRS